MEEDELWDAFLAGFMCSGEGWNGEMSRFWEESGTEDKHMRSLRRNFDEWLDERADE